MIVELNHEAALGQCQQIGIKSVDCSHHLVPQQQAMTRCSILPRVAVSESHVRPHAAYLAFARRTEVGNAPNHLPGEQMRFVAGAEAQLVSWPSTMFSLASVHC